MSTFGQRWEIVYLALGTQRMANVWLISTIGKRSNLLYFFMLEHRANVGPSYNDLH